MKFFLTLESDHAVFDGEEGDLEVKRILLLVSDLVTHGGILGGGLSDPDGKGIGMWRYRRGRTITPPED